MEQYCLCGEIISGSSSNEVRCVCGRTWMWDYINCCYKIIKQLEEEKK